MLDYLNNISELCSSDRVAAAHLHPLEKFDKINIHKYNTIWNSYAQKQINEHK